MAQHLKLKPYSHAVVSHDIACLSISMPFKWPPHFLITTAYLKELFLKLTSWWVLQNHMKKKCADTPWCELAKFTIIHPLVSINSHLKLVICWHEITIYSINGQCICSHTFNPNWDWLFLEGEREASSVPSSRVRPINCGKPKRNGGINVFLETS